MNFINRIGRTTPSTISNPLCRRLAMLVGALTPLAPAVAADGTTVLVSVGSGETQGQDVSRQASLSAEGRFVAFESLAKLSPLDTDGASDVYVRDVVLGETYLVSLDENGQSLPGACTDPAISGTGRYVAFQTSRALVSSDTNGKVDVYLRDRQVGTTTLVSRTAQGNGGNQESVRPFVTADGRFVAFESEASNLDSVLPDTNPKRDVYVLDRTAGVLFSPTQATGNECEGPSLSTDGGWLVFACKDTTLVPNDTNDKRDVFLMQLVNHVPASVRCLTLSHSGAFQGGPNDLHADRELAISADGRFVVFASALPSIVPNDTNGNDADIFVHDVVANATEIVSRTSSGQQLFGQCNNPSISADGRYVAFDAGANFVPALPNGSIEDVFLRDRATGATSLISVTFLGNAAAAESVLPALSADGRKVAFQSKSGSLVLSDQNGDQDVFLRTEGSPYAEPFCAGDGLGAACPCGSNSVAYANTGCPSSLGKGARLRGSGIASLAADSFVLLGSDMPDDQAIYFQGSLPTAGGAGLPFGDGLRCAAGTLVRLGTKQNAAGSSSYPQGSDAAISVRGLISAPGVRLYHVWYRDAAPFCTSASYNSTNGLSVTWTP